MFLTGMLICFIQGLQANETGDYFDQMSM